MNVKKIFFYVIFLVGNTLYCQNKPLLKKLWTSYKQEKSNVNRVKKLNSLGNEYLGFNIDSAIVIANKSKNISISIRNNKEQINASLILSKAYVRQGKISKALNIVNSSLVLSEATKNIEYKIKCLTQIAVCFYRQYKIDLAIKTIETSKTLADSINNDFLKYSATLYHAQFIIKKDIEKAEILTNNVYKKIKDSNSNYQNLKLHALINKESILIDKGEYELCKELTLEISERLKPTNNLYQHLKSEYLKGTCNRLLGKYDESENIILATLKLATEYKFNWISAICKTEQGIIESKKKLYQKALMHQQEALQLIKDFEDAYYLKAKILNYIGSLYILKGENKNAVNYFRKALIVSEKTHNIYRTRSILTNLANILRINKKYQEALDLYKRIEKINKASNIILDAAYTKINIGNVYEDQKKYEKTIDAYKTALMLMNKSSDKFGKIYALLKLAGCYSKLNKSNPIFKEEALYYYQEVLRLIGDASHKHDSYLECIVGMGKLLIHSNRNKAKEYLLEALYLNKNTPKNVDLLTIFDALGEIAFENKNYEKSLKYYIKALELRGNFYQEYSATTYHIGLAKAYQKLNQNDSSSYHLKTALTTTDLEEKILAFSAATTIFKNENKYKDALIYSDSIPVLKDQFHRENDQAIVDGMLLEMKLTKDLEIEQKKNELKSQQLKSRNYFMVAAFAMVLALLFGLFYFKNNNTKNKQLAKQEQDYRTKQDQLFANLSHEFRTPLTVLKTSIEKTNNTTNSKLLLKNTNHLIDLTNQILDISRLSENKISLDPSPVDVVRLTKQLLEQVQSSAESKNIQLKLRAPSSAIMISLDEKILRKIIINLVFNAIKFTENGGLVEVILDFKNKYWNLTVKDNGIGIDVKEIPHIFERYYRAPLHENRASTGGLGLALTKQLVELVKGRIEVKSELKKGSEFHITFPNNSEIETKENLEYINYNITQEKTPVASITKSNITSTKSVITHKENTPTVLLIEDNSDLNNIIHSELSNHFKTLSTFNGSEALKALKKERPDIIITDIMMPIMNGIEFIETIKSTPEFKSIPIIVMSALEEKHNNMKLWKLGVVDFITKPFDLQVLLFKITNNLKTFQESSNQYKNLKSLTANLIHDLRSPVITLQMIANDLLENKEEDLDKHLNYITENSNNLLELINGLTEINRIHKRTSYSSFNVLNCMNNVLFNLDHLVKTTNASMNQQVENLEIMMDKTDFTRVLQNLIQNALTYTSNDVYPEIDISIFSKKKNILSIVVKDNGKGIPENDFDNIFKQLKRGSSSKGTQGTGLGLYIVKEITNKYQGEIKVDSKVNEYTSFSITLKLKSIT